MQYGEDEEPKAPEDLDGGKGLGYRVGSGYSVSALISTLCDWDRRFRRGRSCRVDTYRRDGMAVFVHDDDDHDL